MTDENDYEWQAKNQGRNQRKQSRWEARLGRKRSNGKMSFKFLVKFRM
jgi:hypothetical protein